jgi:anti-repressor protein
MNDQDALRVFNFEEKRVRVVTKDGEPWWVLKDVCDVLDIGNSRDVAARLDDDEKGVGIIDTLGGEQETTVVSESGLYNVILLSRKPEAKKFKHWVTHEILPSIRKHGAYMTPEVLERVVTNPDFMIGVLTKLKEEREKRAMLEEREKTLTTKIEHDHPKVLFADSVSASETSILIGDLAKLIRQNGREIGQKRLFEWLRQNGYLMKNGASRNMPTQRALDMKLFEVLERAIDNPDGSIRITRTTKVTGKGQLYFVNQFLGDPRPKAA